jgi:hypothetical protein
VHTILAGKHDENNLLKDPDVDGMIILKCIFSEMGLVWIGLLSIKGQLRIFLNTVMNLRV